MLPKYIQAGIKTEYAAQTGAILTANSGMHVITIAESGGFITFLAAGQYNEGLYRYTITVAGALVEAGRFYVLPSLAAGDGRTKNQRTLDAIDAVLQGRASQNQLSVTVDDKSIRYLSHHELLAMRSYYADMVDEEMAALTGIDNSVYYARFTRT